jgi:hypothetical protein
MRRGDPPFRGMNGKAATASIKMISATMLA